MGFPVTLKWEILNVPFFPGCRFFPFRLYSLVFKCRADPEGGGGVGGPDPIPGKSQVLSNSIEISIWTPLVNSWTPPRIPGKFWTKKPQNKHKKNQGCFLAVGLGPPPLSLILSDKKIWICACIDHSTAHPCLTQCQKELGLYGYVCTLAELSTNHRGPQGGGGGLK